MAKAKKAAPKAAKASDEGKTNAIIAHITWIGWLIALLLDKKKDQFTRFYLRQLLILFLASFLAWIPVIGWIVGIAVFVFWIISLIGAINGEKKEVPIVGKLGQDWFKGL